jgi:zinc/manganese transport system substrate-binding protein
MFKNRYLHILGVLAVLLTVGLGLVGCSQQSSTNQSSSKIKVISSVDFYGEAAKKVLGTKGTVTSVINKPSVDPHDYQPTAGVAKEVTQADVILYNGIGYDSWMTKLAKNNKSAEVIRVGEDVWGKKTGDNPHLWYDTRTMPKLVNYLVKKFSKLQPKNKAYFKKNAQAYLKQLKRVSTKVKQLSKNSNHKLVDVSEPVFDYALNELGYRENNTGFAESVEKGVDPSPKDIKQMQQDIKDQKIAYFVQNTQATDKTVSNLVKLAKKYNVPVLQVTETMPKNKTYVQWMLSQYNQLAKIQQQEK